MIVGFEEHGFVVAAEHMPDTCTKVESFKQLQRYAR